MFLKISLNSNVPTSINKYLFCQIRIIKFTHTRIGVAGKASYATVYSKTASFLAVITCLYVNWEREVLAYVYDVSNRLGCQETAFSEEWQKWYKSSANLQLVWQARNVIKSQSSLCQQPIRINKLLNTYFMFGTQCFYWFAILMTLTILQSGCYIQYSTATASTPPRTKKVNSTTVSTTCCAFQLTVKGTLYWRQVALN